LQHGRKTGRGRRGEKRQMKTRDSGRGKRQKGEKRKTSTIGVVER